MPASEAPDTAPEETAPEFTSPLTDTHVDDGDTVTLECHVTGQPTPDVTWHKDDKLLPNCSDSCQSYVNGVAKLVLADIVGSGAGVYLCTAKNQAGEAKSEANVSVRGGCLLELDVIWLTFDSNTSSDHSVWRSIILLLKNS